MELSCDGQGSCAPTPVPSPDLPKGFIPRMATTDELGISHRIVKVNGVSLHVAEKGTGPLVILLHGFPELWYSWRHQVRSRLGCHDH